MFRATLRAPGSKEVIECSQGEMPWYRRNPLSDLSHIPECKSKHKWQMIHDRLILVGSQIRSYWGKQNPARKLLFLREMLLLLQVLVREAGHWRPSSSPCPPFCLLLKVRFMAQPPVKHLRGLKNTQQTCEHTLLQINSAKSCKQL